MKSKGSRLIIRFALITLGCFIYAAGIALFLDPNKLAPGGTTGIAIIINKLTSFKTGTLTLMINIPILAFGWWRFGTKFIVSTIYATTISSWFMNLITDYGVKPYGLITKNPLLAGAAGGAMMAVGMAMIFRQGATTGGTDVIVRALRQKFRHVKSGTIFIISDAMIITAAAIAFKDIEVALYAVITVVISNFVLDSALYGGDSAKLLYIISEQSD
ncbi:MAG: YitT family protein, partial [Lachnospiraceae bacterium]|nr:YitT family protein [Lachnospiraceae bacterium]